MFYPDFWTETWNQRRLQFRICYWKSENLIRYSGKPGEKAWRWIDEWPLSHSDWAVNYPDPKKGECAAMDKNGQFFSSDCQNARKPFVCKAEFYDFLDNDSLEDRHKGSKYVRNRLRLKILLEIQIK